MTDERNVVMKDAPDEGAYVVEVDGERVGRAEYKVRDDRYIFTHTEVDDEHSGAGVATRLIKYALDDVQSRGLRIVPLCPLVAAYIRRHPEYEEMVDHEMTMEIKKRRKRR